MENIVASQTLFLPLGGLVWDPFPRSNRGIQWRAHVGVHHTTGRMVNVVHLLQCPVVYKNIRSISYFSKMYVLVSFIWQHTASFVILLFPHGRFIP